MKNKIKMGRKKQMKNKETKKISKRIERKHKRKSKNKEVKKKNSIKEKIFKVRNTNFERTKRKSDGCRDIGTAKKCVKTCLYHMTW